MLRTRNLTDLFLKRSIQPRYAFTQATPYAGFLDTAAVGTTVIVPGMVATKTTGEMFKLATATTDVPFGLFANYVNGTVDELSGGTEIGIWRGGPDSEFEIQAAALDPTVTWTALDATAGGVLLYHNASGKLTNVQAASTKPIARLVSAPSNSKILVMLELTYTGTA